MCNIVEHCLITHIYFNTLSHFELVSLLSIYYQTLSQRRGTGKKKLE